MVTTPYGRKAPAALFLAFQQFQGHFPQKFRFFAQAVQRGQRFLGLTCRIIGLFEIILQICNFIPQVLKKSIPRALLMLFNAFIVIFLGSNYFNTLSPSEYDTLITLVLTFTGFLNLAWLCFPLTKLKAVTLCLSFVLLVAACLIMPKFFVMTDFSFVVLVTFFAIMAFSLLILFVVYMFQGKIKLKKAKKQETDEKN